MTVHEGMVVETIEERFLKVQAEAQAANESDRRRYAEKQVWELERRRQMQLDRDRMYAKYDETDDFEDPEEFDEELYYKSAYQAMMEYTERGIITWQATIKTFVDQQMETEQKRIDILAEAKQLIDNAKIPEMPNLGRRMGLSAIQPKSSNQEVLLRIVRLRMRPVYDMAVQAIVALSAFFVFLGWGSVIEAAVIIPCVAVAYHNLARGAAEHRRRKVEPFDKLKAVEKYYEFTRPITLVRTQLDHLEEHQRFWADFHKEIAWHEEKKSTSAKYGIKFSEQ